MEEEIGDRERERKELRKSVEGTEKEGRGVELEREKREQGNDKGRNWDRERRGLQARSREKRTRSERGGGKERGRREKRRAEGIESKKDGDLEREKEQKPREVMTESKKGGDRE